MLKKYYHYLILIKVILVYFVACSQDVNEGQVSPDKNKTRIPDQESWNSTMISTNLGNVKAKIWFGHMSKYEESNEYEFDQNLQVNFYDEMGNLKSRITSKKGFLDENRKFMEVFGNVVAHSDSANMTLYTERLQWSEKREKIVSNEFVTITTKQDTLYGIGFESNSDLTHWHIKKPTGHTSRPVDLKIDEHFEEKSGEEKK